MSALPSKTTHRVIASGLFLALLLLTFGWRRLHEGSYAGKTTRYWVEKALNGDRSQETDLAVIALSPKAISLLLDEMTASDSSWKMRWTRLYERFPKFFGRFLARPRDGGERRFQAFAYLNHVSDSVKGPQMRGLVPKLAANLASFDQRPSSAFVDEKNVAMPHGIYVWMVSASILGSIGPYASNAVPALIAALDEHERWKHFRSVLLRAIGEIGPAAKEALPALRQEMRSAPVTGVWAAEAAWRIEPAEKANVNAFIETTGLKLTNLIARLQVALVHWRINRNAEAVLPIFVGLIEDPANPAVAYTIYKLEELGDAARAALPVLSNKLSDKDESVQKAAEAAIRKISAEPK